MDWRDTGILLTTRKHGESSVILEVFTPERGRHAGVLRGGASRRMQPHLQPGTQLQLEWHARLEDHLGQYRVEPLRSRAATAMSDRVALAGLNATCAMLAFALPERVTHPRLYESSRNLLDLLHRPDLWPLAYMRWELALLEELGFGLDLTSCAVTGETEDLAYVSPRSGRAVTRAGAGDWAHRLLPLPPVLRGEGEASDREVHGGLEVTGFFLDTHLSPLAGRPLPAARAAFLDRLARRAET